MALLAGMRGYLGGSFSRGGEDILGGSFSRGGEDIWAAVLVGEVRIFGWQF